jgi:UDP-3-O-acyl N-acetylglucosamine deacetylase
MSSHPQFTVASRVTLEGVGLHTGQTGRVQISPSERGEVDFIRDGIRIPARADQVTQTARCTMLGGADHGVSTVEHILAALLGLGIGSADVCLEGPEIPVLDGSAAPFAHALREAGRQALPGERRCLPVEHPVWISEKGSSLIALPSDEFRVTVAVEYPHPLVGRQLADFVVTPETFEREIAQARTFGFEHELEELARRGLALGGSFENALVFLDHGTSSPLRFPDEPVRHKALDVIGDLALTGALPLAHVIAVRPSHRLNIEFARVLLQHGKITHECKEAGLGF